MDSSTSYPAIYSKLPQKLPAQGTYSSTVQRETSETRHPVFFSKLPEKLPEYDTQPSSLCHRGEASGIRYPQPSSACYPDQASRISYSVFPSTPSCMQRCCQKPDCSEPMKILAYSVTYGRSHVMGILLKLCKLYGYHHAHSQASNYTHGKQ